MNYRKINVLLGATIAALLIAVGVLVFNFVIKPSNTVVPDFIGKDVSEVYTWCGELDDTHACEVSYEDSDEYEKDVVFEQSVKGGNKLKTDTVHFKVATGDSAVIALPFIGPETNKSDIEAWAMTFGIENITYIEETSETVTKNHVIRIEPSSNVHKKTPLNVYISTGKKEVAPTEITVKFGDYLNMSVNDFEKKAKELGLRPNHNTVRDQYDPHIEFGKIVWHGSGTYEPGEIINYGVCVNEIVIEAGKYVGKTEDEFIKIAKELGLVPTHLSNRDAFSTAVDKGSVVTHGSGTYVKDEAFNYGLSLGAAKIEGGYEGASEEVFLSYISKFGLNPNRKTQTSDSVAAGRIITYNTGKYSTGDAVTYVVSLGPDTSVNVPDFSGQNESDLLDFINSNGLKVGIKSVQTSMTPNGKIISNDNGTKNKGDTINYVVSSGPYIPTATIDNFEYLSEMISSKDDFAEAAEKAELYLKEKGFDNYEIQSVFLSSVKPGQLLMVTVDDVQHTEAKDYPIYSRVVVQISSWLTAAPHN